MRIIKSCNTIVENILEMFNGGRLKDEYRPSVRQIKFMLYYWRATLIRRDMDKNGMLADSIKQSFCINFDTVDESECCDVETGCTIIRSIDKIPSPIMLKGGEDLQVWPNSKISTPYTKVHQAAVSDLSGNKYTQKEIKWFLENGYIYLVSSNPLNKIITKGRITGSFENPYLAARFTTCSGEPCYTDDSEFPMPMYMIEQFIRAIFSGELRFTKETPEDIENDGLPYRNN